MKKSRQLQIQMSKEHFKKIGFFGGTFDPVHFGHINVVIEAKERLALDEVWFCPTSISPHKEDTPPIEAHHRFEMLRLALENIPFCKVIDDELNEKKPPFTFETLKKCAQKYGLLTQNFTLILSQDLLPRLGQWYKANELIEQYTLFIAQRAQFELHSEKTIPGLSKENFEKVIKSQEPVRLLEISSQNVRQRLKKKLYCGHLCPLKVIDYIYQFNLY